MLKPASLAIRRPNCPTSIQPILAAATAPVHEKKFPASQDLRRGVAPPSAFDRLPEDARLIADQNFKTSAVHDEQAVLFGGYRCVSPKNGGFLY